MTSETESQVPIDPSAATEKQAKLTTSVGETLTRESNDARIEPWLAEEFRTGSYSNQLTRG